MAISNISHMRKVFPENYFNPVPDLEMTIKKLMRKDAESSRMIDWMEKGVNDALKKERLKTLLFCVCETVGGAMIEEYAFSFSYPNSEITPNQMRSSLCQIGALILLIGTLDEMPEERTILMKLLYYENVTPEFYEPPCFKRCTEEEFNNPWTKNPLKWKVGNVNSKDVNNKPLVFALEVKSVLYDSLGAGCVEVDASVLKTEPAASRGMAQVMEFARTKFKGESSSHCKRSRKASIVKEPILQKAQVA